MITITDFPANPKTSEPFTLKGTATELDEGEELIILVDGRFEVARPPVQAGKWEITLIFNRGGDRVIEVIASDQDRAEITLDFETGQLEVIPRSVWGAKPPKSTLNTLPNPKRITIHHTVTTILSSTASKSTEEARMRQIQEGEMQPPQSFSDIGYHYVIMPSGRIYEGRPNGKKGAHDLINDGFGVAFDGSFQLAGSKITDAQFDSAVALCTQLCKKIGITDTTTLVSTPTAFPGKPAKNLPRIIGHRDRVETLCPGMKEGSNVRLEEIRQAVNARL
jgi:hypothetical protein